MITFSEFKDILVERQVFILVIGFLMSEEIRKLTRSVIDNIIEPIIDMDINQNEEEKKTFFEKVYNTRGITFKYGAFLRSILDFIIMTVVAMLIVYLIQKSIKKKD